MGIGAESRRGIVERRTDEAAALYWRGWSLARIGQRYGVYLSTVRHAMLRAGVRMRPRPGAGPNADCRSK